MSVINLNDSKFAGSKVFNNGNAGLVTVTIDRITKKQPSDADNTPDYRVFYKDSSGAEINQGWYYFTVRQGDTDEQIEQKKGYELSRLVSLARTVLGPNAELPEVTDVQNALDVVMNIVSKNAGDTQYNVFVTYGTVQRPSRYLELRRFNFIAPADVTLTATNRDQMSRVEADAPQQAATQSANSGWSAT